MLVSVEVLAVEVVEVEVSVEVDVTVLAVLSSCELCEPTSTAGTLGAGEVF